jgi:hypothetical protein
MLLTVKPSAGRQRGRSATRQSSRRGKPAVIPSCAMEPLGSCGVVKEVNLRRSAVMVLVVALQPACDDSARPETKLSNPVATVSPSADVTTHVRVTRDGEDAPTSCTPQQVGELVVGFLAAINEDAVEASRFFASDMEWYSVTEWTPDAGKRHFVINGYDSEKLESYFRRRAKQHERVHLLEIDVAYEPSRNLGHVAYALERTADDLPDSDPIVIGKGAIDCATGTIAVWSMSHDTRFQRAPALCPGDARPPRIAIACTRG